MQKTIFFPIIIINLKSYIEGLGERALKLAKYSVEVHKITGVKIALAPQYVDIPKVSETGILTFAQHVDPIRPGSYTGHITLEAIKSAGAQGTLINHSEKRLLLSDIGFLINRGRELGLITLVCADTPKTAASASVLGPDMVAIEPPELIGTGKAVSKVSPRSVIETVDIVKRVNPNVHVICGAGITTGEDVKAALQLGAEGVLVASAVVKSTNPKEKILELAKAASKY